MTGLLRRRFVPPTDIMELPDRIRVLVEIAGMQRDNLNITLVNRTLVISGIRGRNTEDLAAYHQLEIGYGEFRVEVKLAWSIDQDEVSATYQDGFLQVDLPRRAEKNVHVSGVREETEKHDTQV